MADGGGMNEGSILHIYNAMYVYGCNRHSISPYTDRYTLDMLRYFGTFYGRSMVMSAFMVH